MDRRLAALPAALIVATLALPTPALAKRKKPKSTRRPKPTPTMGPLYGPPAPTPSPLLRAAGTCLDFESGQFLLLAEVGATGRMFRLDAETDVTTPVRKGSRVRVLYTDGPNGPVARRILPGPAEAAPSPNP